MSEPAGKVSLVGAGPGAPDLITVRGRRCLREAEVVLHDGLVSRELLAEAPASAERIDVGKRHGAESVRQEEIGRLLVEKAREGKRVVRLKGGDPFVFGHGGEEAEVLAAAGIAFEVVPGVSAAVAAPAFAGIPLTHRALAGGFEVWSGHDPASASALPRTVVVLMGVRRLEENVARLLAAGRAGSTPAALVEQGSLACQRTVVATLETIAGQARAAKLASPAALVVGEVVRLREQLAWFERAPLFGLRVLVTRTREQARETCRALEELGAQTVVMPTIALVPPEDGEPLRRAVRELASYRFVVLTSANAVAPLKTALAEAGLDARALAGATLCAIGPGTAAAALAELGLRADLIPADHRAEGLLELLTAERVRGQRVLIPRAAVARELLPEELAARGAEVDLIPVYRTVLPDPAETRGGLAALEAGEVDVLTFTSASTAENFAAILGSRLAALTAGRLVVAIGPVTRDACERVGLKVDLMPASYTIHAMTAALVQHVAARRQSSSGAAQAGESGGAAARNQPEP